MFLKPCLNLGSRIWWLKPNLSFVNNFIANGSLILKIFQFNKILLELRMFGSILFHSSMACGKKDF